MIKEYYRYQNKISLFVFLSNITCFVLLKSFLSVFGESMQGVRMHILYLFPSLPNFPYFTSVGDVSAEWAPVTYILLLLTGLCTVIISLFYLFLVRGVQFFHRYELLDLFKLIFVIIICSILCFSAFFYDADVNLILDPIFDNNIFANSILVLMISLLCIALINTIVASFFLAGKS